MIRAGELVAFPTETVYGLGANALDATAVERIFEVKGRPATSPLIVHVDTIAMAQDIIAGWPERAQLLATAFWPGALTLVLPKRASVPDRVTAGLLTVGVRVPAHPVALALIREAGVPIAAPSANRFTGLSPTTAAHVLAALGDRVALILDGGPTRVGIESTVLSLTGGNAVLLRPGMVSQAEIESVIGPVLLAGQAGEGAQHMAHPAPGMHRKHYSPKTRVVLGPPLLNGRGAQLRITQPALVERTVQMPDEPSEYAALLYATLHELDAEGLDWIAVETPPEDPRWSGIHDRLRRAASE